MLQPCVPLANSVCCQDLRRRRLIAARRHAASRLRDCGGVVLLRLLHPGSAAIERTAARFSNRRRSRCTYPREGPGWSLTNSGRAPLVAVVKTAGLRNGHDASELRRMYGPRLRRVLGQREVRPGFVINRLST